MDPKEKISMKDIAKLAGVSASTVSRIINNSGQISEKTKKKFDNDMDIKCAILCELILED